MTMIRGLAVAAVVLATAASAFAQGKPATVGAGIVTSGATPSGQPTPPSGVTPQGGNNTAKGNVTNPNAVTKIGHGSAK